MDFVVLGFGVGALAVLAGLLVRAVAGPTRATKTRGADGPWHGVALDPPETAIEPDLDNKTAPAPAPAPAPDAEADPDLDPPLDIDLAPDRYPDAPAVPPPPDGQDGRSEPSARDAGRLIALAGAGLWALTAAATLLRASDAVGMLVVAAGIAAAALALAAWWFNAGGRRPGHRLPARRTAAPAGALPAPLPLAAAVELDAADQRAVTPAPLPTVADDDIPAEPAPDADRLEAFLAKIDHDRPDEAGDAPSEPGDQPGAPSAADAPPVPESTAEPDANPTDAVATADNAAVDVPTGRQPDDASTAAVASPPEDSTPGADAESEREDEVLFSEPDFVRPRVDG